MRGGLYQNPYYWWRTNSFDKMVKIYLTSKKAYIIIALYNPNPDHLGKYPEWRYNLELVWTLSTTNCRHVESQRHGVALLFPSVLFNCEDGHVSNYCHVGQIDQTDHDLDHLDPNLSLWNVVQHLCGTDPTKKISAKICPRSCRVPGIRLPPGNMN